jgi:hypothetical protein
MFSCKQLTGDLITCLVLSILRKLVFIFVIWSLFYSKNGEGQAGEHVVWFPCFYSTWICEQLTAEKVAISPCSYFTPMSEQLTAGKLHGGHVLIW